MHQLGSYPLPPSQQQDARPWFLKCLPNAWAPSDALQQSLHSRVGLSRGGGAAAAQGELAAEVQRLYPTIRAMTEMQASLLDRLDDLTMRVNSLDHQLLDYHRSGSGGGKYQGLFSNRMRVNSLFTASKRSAELHGRTERIGSFEDGLSTMTGTPTSAEPADMMSQYARKQKAGVESALLAC